MVRVPSYVPMTVHAVLRKGLPRMIGTSPSSCMSITTKSPGTKNFPTFIGMSSTIPIGKRTDESASWIVIRVGLSSPTPILRKTVCGIKLTLAPKSHNAFWIRAFPIVHGIVNFPKSPSLGGNSRLRTTLHSWFRTTFLHSLRLRLLDKISFKNLA